MSCQCECFESHKRMNSLREKVRMIFKNVKGPEKSRILLQGVLTVRGQAGMEGGRRDCVLRGGQEGEDEVTHEDRNEREFLEGRRAARERG